MITFPNAKINLGLNIVEKRPDGYHNLETVFYPVPLEDALEVNILHEGNEKFRLHQAGLEIEGEVENNLVVKAYKLLDKEIGEKTFPIPSAYVGAFRMKKAQSAPNFAAYSSKVSSVSARLNFSFNNFSI